LTTGDGAPGQGSPGWRPGQVILGAEPIAINEGRATVTLRVDNTGDRPIQVGSHFHFFEANPALEFDRGAARGFRLGIPAGTSVRFEPGVGRDVDLVAFAGARVAAGFRGQIGGPLDA
jgi:urease beta subunit